MTPLPSPFSSADNAPVPSLQGNSPIPEVNGTIIEQGATIFIGEQGLNITHALNQANAASDNDGVPVLTRIGWWPSAAQVGSTAPTTTIDASATYKSFFVNPSDFVGYPGSWYLLDASGTAAANATDPVLSALDPTLDLRIWDVTHEADVTGTSVSSGTRLRFRIDTNMYAAVDLDHRSPINPATDGFINIIVKNESGTVLSALYNDSTDKDPSVAGPNSVLKYFVFAQPSFWGSYHGFSWKTDATDNGIALYPDGTYTAQAESTLNHMKDNYKNAGVDYTGKTVSAIYHVNLTSVIGSPVAGFTATPTSGTAPLTVNFTDTSTGSPTAWNWTFGDGQFSVLQNPQHEYTNGGTYAVSLNATNVAGSNTTTKSGYITVSGSGSGWTIETVDSSENVGDTLSLKLDAGNTPHISYHDATNNNLKYAAWDGSAWTVTTVDNTGDVSIYQSLALGSNGWPHISYSNITNGGLNYAAWDGASWIIEQVDTEGFADLENSIALDDSDNPRIAFIDDTTPARGGLNYAQKNGGVWTNVTVDTGGAGPVSLALNASDFPRISYSNSLSGDLRFAAWNGAEWVTETVDSNGNVGDAGSLALDASGYPRISYYDTTNSALKYAAWNGTGWEISTVDSAGLVGLYNSLALNASGYPRISYYDATTQNLKYAVWDGAAWDIEVVDNTGTVGNTNSLALDSGGLPHISYYDTTNGDLKYASQNGSASPAPVAGFTGTPTSGPAPLTVVFTDTSTGSPTAWSWDFGDGQFSVLQNPEHVYANAGIYTVSLNATNANGSNVQIRNNYITVSGGGPSAPVAGFAANVTYGSPPLAVKFSDLSTNSPIQWNWSFGDGSYSALKEPVHVYAGSGTYTVSLNATNGAGSNTTAKTGYITAGESAWAVETVDDSGEMGDFTSLALDSGDNPHISYLDASDSYLRYGSKNSGTWSTENVDTGALAGWYPSLVMDTSDNPRISYVGGVSDDLRYAAWNGAGWTIETVDAGGANWEPTSLRLDSSGNPRISYHNFSDSNLRLASWNGASWSLETVDSVGDVGLDSSLVLDGDDHPRISYYDQTNGALKYAAWDGASWAIETVDDQDDTGLDTSLALDSSGNPRISYYSISNGNLKYAAKNSGSWDIETVDSVGDVGKHTSLALDGSDYPHISYWDLQYDDLKYASWDGTAWVIETVDGAGDVGWYTSLALDSNYLPHISYYDYTNTALKYATKGAGSVPVAGFTGTPTSGPAPLTVVFTDTSTGSPTAWSWDFGDGQFSVLQNPEHVYANAGIYTVSLNATNANGSNVSVRTDYISISAEKPVPGFTADVTSGSAPLSVQFTDLTTGSPTGWSWYFGDEEFTQPWTEVNASASWPDRFYHASVVSPDGSVYVMGGEGTVLGMNDTWRSTDNGLTWTEQSEGAPWKARASLTSVALPDNSIVVMAGVDPDFTFHNDTWRSTDHGVTWSLMNGSPTWLARANPSSIALDDGTIILLAGGDQNRMMNDTWRSTDYGATWNLVNASSGWSARLYPSLVSLPDGGILLIGGSDGGCLNDTWRSDDYGSTWSLVTVSGGWPARDSQNSVVLPDGSVILIGGVDPDYNFLNDMWRSVDDGVTWTLLNSSAEWSVRSHQTSVVLNDGSILMMGGNDGSTRNDVWRFDNAGSLLQNPSHSYTEPGIYSVALQVSNADTRNSTRKADYIHVNSLVPPVAGFTGTPTSGPAPLTVVFTDTSTGSPTAWSWDFGDGDTTNATVKNPVHTYTYAGHYTVSLNATNTQGSNVTVQPYSITVTSSAPSMMYRSNPWHSGTYDDGGTRPNNILNWTFATANSVSSTPAIVDGVVYVGSGDGKVYALNADTGIEYWNFSVFSLNESYSPAVTEGRVYFGATDGKVYALNATTGSKVWEFSAGESVNSDVTIQDGILYTGSGTPDRIYALNAHDGTELWHFNAAGNVATSPAVAGGIVYAGSNDGNLYAVHANNGTLAWAYPTGEFIHSSPSVVNGTVYFGSFNTQFYALNATTGVERWNFSAGDFGRSSPAVADSIVYVGNRDGNLYALNATTGAVVWTYPFGDWMDYSPAVANGVLYIGGSDHNLHALDATTGALLWQYDAGVISLNNVYDPAVADGKVFFGCREGRIYALGGPPGPAPVAGFTATPTTGIVPLTVVFTDTSANMPTAWNWTFGDGDTTNATVQNPVHTFARAGTYTVSLNATNSVGSNVSVRTNYITVNAQAKPKIDSVAPLTAITNRTINVTIKGSNFDPAPGRTWVNFTQGTFDNRNLTVTEITPAKINVTMVIPHDAPTGGWNLSVSTFYGKQSDVRKNAITVSRFPAAVIDKVEPASWLRNTTVAFVFTGKNFLPGQTSVFLVRTAGGASLNPLTITSITPTRIEGTVDVPADAPLGNGWSVNVFTIDSGRNGTRPSAFTVANTPPPTIGSLTPNSGFKNTTMAFTLAGTNFQTGAGKTRVRIYEDVMDTELAVNITSQTPTKITGTAEVTNDAMAGSYILEVKTVDGGTVTKPAAFSVKYSGIPTITAFKPDSGYHNETVGFTITGTNFQPGNTVVALKNQTTGAVLNATNLTSVTSTAITGTIHVPANAPTGYYRLDLTTTDGGVTNKRNAFRVKQVMPPTIASITPTTGAKGSVVAFTIRGSNFQGGDKTTVQIYDVVSGTWLSTTLVQVTETTIIGRVTIPNSAPSGKYTLDVRTADGGTVSRYEVFTVNYLGLPTIGSIVPATGKRGTNVNFTLKGSNFVDGGTIVRLRIPGSTINSTVLSANSTMVLGYFPIAGGATTGPYRLDVFTIGGGINSKLSGFAVTA